MKIEFDNIKIEIPYEEYFEKLSSSVNPLEVMFSKSNQDFFNNLFKETSLSITNYFDEFTKLMAKYANKNQPDKRDD